MDAGDYTEFEARLDAVEKLTADLDRRCELIRQAVEKLNDLMITLL